MRSPRNSLIADLRRTAETARETAASALYGLEPLRQAMTKAAGAGFEHVTVDGPDGLDLRDTPAARAAVAWLIETRLTHRWDPRPGATGADRAGGWNLVVSWRPEVSAIG